MDGLSDLSLTNITRDCFANPGVCTFFAPAALLFTLAAVAVPLFVFLLPRRRVGRSGLFGTGYAFGVLQGFLMVRLSQGRDSEDEGDNDIALFFLGLCVLVVSSLTFVIDFFETVAQLSRNCILGKAAVCGLVCVSTVALVLLPSDDLYDLVGLLNMGCIILQCLFHLLVGAASLCTRRVRPPPSAYTSALAVCFVCWAGMLLSSRGHSAALLITTFCVCAGIETAVAAVGARTRVEEKEQSATESFGKNIWQNGSTESRNVGSSLL